MKILTRYILREFSKPFILWVLAFSVLVLIIQVFNDMRFILEHKPGLWLAFKYFVLQVPALSIKIVPIAVLMAVLLSLSRLSKNNELIAMRAGGVSISFVAIPLFFSGIAIGCFTIFFNEIVVPKTIKMVRHTKLVEILKSAEPSANLYRQNISMIGINGQIYHITSYDGSANSMTDVLILQFDNNNRLKSRIDAKSAKWENDRWIFQNGYLRVFDDNDNEISAQAFDRMPIPLPEKPGDFLKEQKEPQDRNLVELAAYVLQLSRNGSDVHKELVELHYKIAVPFGCVILAVLGVPWGWGMRKYSGVVFSFGICLLVGFFYIGGMEIGHNLGVSGVLSPFLSMWIMNILFAIGAPLLLIRNNR